jgi:hypothetical protein
MIKCLSNWSKKYFLVHWVIVIASVALFVKLAPFAEWAAFVGAVAGWYLKVNLDQKKIEIPKVG